MTLSVSTFIEIYFQVLEKIKDKVCHNTFLCLAGVKEQVIVSAPCGQVLYLLPVGSLIVVSDEANHRGVICTLDDGVGSTHRPAVMGVEGVEEWAQHTALWNAGVECDGGGAGVA